ncbi:autotransporter outer membrane beta-barrel domain-containing protein [Escherichia coli]|uniref:autotransporter outer membrane beta-barrel domain-containing protein n=1 Tax=Escherichia coli TaxID=562 RepID=UPI000A1895DC|nr:autotransporter outer membrane beta-barrel domain-containing protein [Escherichia coli]OSL84484.1 outer membrane protein IcsA [Escherichia coli T426]
MIKGDIVLNSTASGDGNSLSVTSNISDTSLSAVDGNLKAGDNTTVSFSGNKVTFSGDASFGEGSSLTLNGDNGLATQGAMSFGNTAKVNINNVITDWTQNSYDLLNAGNGVNGLTADNISVTSPLLVEGAKDYTHATLGADKLSYGLAWNTQDGSAHGEFALRDGATLTLHTVLADNTGTTHTSGWDGKSLTKSGGGELILATQNTYTGTTTINGGTLKTATDDAIAGTSGVNIAENGTLNLNGHNQTLTDIVNSGTLLINDTGATPLTTPVTVTGDMTLRQSGLVVINNGNSNAGQTLKVEGDWKGEGGTVSLGVVLGDDGSKADQLNIAGHASGSTSVLVANENGSGAQTLEGIKLISSGSSDNNAFVQKGRIVAGSYDYHLQQGSASGQNTSNWYLTSYLPNPPQPDPVDPVNPVNPVQPGNNTRIWRPEAGSYTANLMAANTMFSNTLEDRHGSVVTDPVTGQRYETTLWARAVGGHNSFRMTDAQSRTQANRMVYQMGGEMLTLSFAGDDGLHLGLMGAYGHQNSKTINSVTGYSSRGTVSGYAAGLYGTWYSEPPRVSWRVFYL